MAVVRWIKLTVKIKFFSSMYDLNLRVILYVSYV